MFIISIVIQLLSSGRLCNPIDCSPPGIFQARILEWVAVSFSRTLGKAKNMISRLKAELILATVKQLPTMRETRV